MVCITTLCPHTACIGKACPSFVELSPFAPFSPLNSEISYFSGVAKPINQFTTDELLAEIRRRCER